MRIHFAALICLCALVGCGPKSSPSSDASSKKPDTSALKNDSNKVPNEEQEIIRNGAANVTNVDTDMVDPKTGEKLWNVKAKQSQAASGATSKDILATFENVDATFFSDKKPIGTMHAPHVDADNDAQIAIATGGVKFVSITRKGATLTCDKAIYYVKKRHMIGVGHVVYQDGGFIGRDNSFSADMMLKKVVMPAPEMKQGKLP